MKNRYTWALIAVVLIAITSCNNNDMINPEDPYKDYALLRLQPKELFIQFEDICKVPRATHSTKAITDYVEAFAQKHQLRYKRDNYDNVIIYAEASKGREDDATLALQVHTDMVSVSDDPQNAPVQVGVKPITDGKMIWADGQTSLGADNGIGMAIVMTILNNLEKISHPALEVIFTTNEEAMSTAVFLDMSNISARQMVNLDSEEEDFVTVSSATVITAISTLPVTYETATGYSFFTITVSGLQGGHSGIDIHLGRANAILELAKLLHRIKDCNLRLVNWTGGIADNAIPTQSQVLLAVPNSKVQTFRTQIEELSNALKKSYEKIDPNMQISIESTNNSNSVLSFDSSQSIITALATIPDGMIEMGEMHMASVSLNTGIVELEDNAFKLFTSLRSNKSEAVDDLVGSFKESVNSCGFRIELEFSLPSWDYVSNSPLREKIIACYQSTLGKTPKILAVHGGLECSIFVREIENIDIVSIGPNIHNPHTVNEQVEVQSVANIYAVILELLK